MLETMNPNSTETTQAAEHGSSVIETHREPGAVYPDLAGKVAVVTGGSRGIGAATAQELGRNGVDVAIVGRDQAALEATLATVTAAGGRGIAIVADCTHEDQVSALRSEVEAQLGAVDILAVFAGGNGMPVPTASETGAHWREVIDSDLTSTFLTVSTFLPGMIERHHGVIVTMSPPPPGRLHAPLRRTRPPKPA